VQFSDSQRIGLVCPRLRHHVNPEQPKPLTRDERGLTSGSTCIRIDGYEYLFGNEIPGVRYVKHRGKIQKEVPVPGKDSDRAWRSVMEYDIPRVRVTQSVEIIVGEQTRLYDTALIRYHLWNRDKVAHTVGLRFLLHAQVGSAGGGPFYLAPALDKPARLVDTLAVLPREEIPDFIQVLERGELDDPEAVVALSQLRLPWMEPMEKVVLCRHPGNKSGWSWPYEPTNEAGNQPRDACVVMYWAEVPMQPDEHRDLAFTYGLGRILADKSSTASGVACNGRMRLFVGPRVDPRIHWRAPFIVTAYVKPDPGQSIALKLPPGLSLMPGQQAEQIVPPVEAEGYSQVTWQVRADISGIYIIEAHAPGVGVATENVVIWNY
jgi:hypothetical protein